MELLDLRRLSSARLLSYSHVTADDAVADITGPVLIDLDRLEGDPEVLDDQVRPIGLLAAGDADSTRIVPFLSRLSLIAVQFPKFSDGRGFSLAYRLRRDHGFEGDIRAVGAVLGDHADFLLRTGFSSVELPNNAAVETFKKRLDLYSIRYQDAHDLRPTASELRHGQSRGHLAS